MVARFYDHAPYRPDQVHALLRAGNEHGVDRWLTTAKDCVKLEGIWPSPVPLVVMELEIVWPEKEALPDLVEERWRQGHP